MNTTTVSVVFSKGIHLPCRGKETNMMKSLVAESARRDGMPLGELSASTNVQKIWDERSDIDFLEIFDKNAFFDEQEALVVTIPDG